MSEQATEEQASNTTARVLALLAAWRAGQIDAPDMSRGAAVALYAGKVLASRYADVLVSTLAQRPPLGVRPGEQHLDGLEEAVTTVLQEEPEEPETRLERLAVSEVLESHTASTLAAIRDHGFPEWERVTGEDPCEVCAPLAGEVQPVGTPFRDHPGCQCGVRPHGEPAPEEPTDEPTPRVRITYQPT